MTRQRLIVINDVQSQSDLIGDCLSDVVAEVLIVPNGWSGLAKAIEQRPDLILVRAELPEMSGWRVFESLQEHEATKDIPVVFMINREDTAGVSRCFDIGGADYLNLPLDPTELRARVSSALHTASLSHQLQYLASTDELTGVSNRESFINALQRHIDSRPDDAFAVIVVAVDRLKTINTGLGRIVGDELLKGVANNLRRCLRVHSTVSRGIPDMVGRLGGDEFAVLLSVLDHEDDSMNVAHRLAHAVRQPMAIGGHELVVDISAGVRVSANQETEDAESLLGDASAAMTRAKARGRRQVVRFDNEMRLESIERASIERDLQSCMNDNQLELHYQPIYGLHDGVIRGFEALVRWNHPARGMLSPDVFIPLAEESGAIIDIGKWVLMESCRQLSEWRARHAGAAGLFISVNVSKVQLLHPQFVEDVALVLGQTQVAAGSVKLEITESDIMQDLDRVVPVLGQLRQIGLKLAIDDFGKGHSSLASLHRFPVDVLKIDRAFVNTMDESRDYTAIVGAIITLAQSLGMDVIAEGIETTEHLAQLQALDCPMAQGYYFARPAPAETAERHIQVEHVHKSAA